MRIPTSVIVMSLVTAAPFALWSALPAVKAGRVVRLPSLWEFGALPTARCFARSLSEALLDGRG